MATILWALRFAANIEQNLYTFRRRYFQATGDTSAMFLPPLIPLAVTPDLPPFHLLESLRKGHHLMLSKGSTADEPIIHGFDRLQNDIRDDFSPIVEDSRLTKGPRPRVQISWNDAAEIPESPKLPATSALWLTLYDITPGEGEAWWSHSKWEMNYCRRLSNRPDPPR